ncbi:L-ascorbate oxidase-like [Heracleum sosnowskyi]|uniref:L-ascorbate oxidase-like n=1 Tax=Heracleum sosnowskyi TaxID=360622 RepID=A0AAD8GVM1_9APIA|nr:L-ascorbate oxidase-like [Heracleum sosnowskyi]
MVRYSSVTAATVLLWLCTAGLVFAEDPYIFMDWNVSYGNMAPLGVDQQVILINGLFPGPKINCTSNNNLIVNIFNHIDEPLLFTFAGVQHRKNSWQDGTPGTMCPIMPGTNFTYKMQVKDQIGSYFYFPTTGMHRAAGGIGPLSVQSRELIPVPFDKPALEFDVLAGDWYNRGHKALKTVLDSGRSVGKPDGIHINGKSAKVGGPAEPMFTMEAGKTYRYRMCNVGMRTSLNFRFQEHSMKLVEIEGSHTVQNIYDNLDIHVGQCMSVLITADKTPKDYYLVVSSRFVSEIMTCVALVRYAGGSGPPTAQIPPGPLENKVGVGMSMNQFRSFRWNLTASAARPNPQGSYHYGGINITRTIKLVNSRGSVNGKLRFGLNGISHVDRDTPVKLAEYFGKQADVFKYNLLKDDPPKDEKTIVLDTNVVNATYRNFVEIIFENHEKTIQAYHLNGFSFFAVGMENGIWSPDKRRSYNLIDAVSRHTIHVFPDAWSAVMTTLDNAGMWNLRSDMWERFYLGQQMYFSVLSTEHSLKDEYNFPDNGLKCGVIKDSPLPPPYVI